jgi:hypothetical protein
MLTTNANPRFKTFRSMRNGKIEETLSLFLKSP